MLYKKEAKLDKKCEYNFKRVHNLSILFKLQNKDLGFNFSVIMTKQMNRNIYSNPVKTDYYTLVITILVYQMCSKI